MKVYKTQSAVDVDLVNGSLVLDDNVLFDFFSVFVPRNITARDINARDIIAGDITAWNITAWNITAENIKAAGHIKAGNIKAWDINAWGITAGNISYFAVCFAYNAISCKRIKGRRDNARHFALDGKVEIEKRERREK